MYSLSRTYRLGYIKHTGCVTLGMLVHWARRGSHPNMPPWSHAHALHLAIAGVIWHSLLVHGFHGLVTGQTNVICETNFDVRLNFYFKIAP